MRYYKDVVNWLFWVLWGFKLNKLKVNLSTCRKPLCLLAGKKSTSSPMLYWRYCKDMQTSYFGYFGNPWLHTPKNDRLAHFILQNFKRIVRADPELLGCAIFGHKMAHLPWANFFWYKPFLLLSSTCWPFSLCKIYKKLWGCHILGSKWSICPSPPPPLPTPKKCSFWKIIKTIFI